MCNKFKNLNCSPCRLQQEILATRCMKMSGATVNRHGKMKRNQFLIEYLGIQRVVVVIFEPTCDYAWWALIRRFLSVRLSLDKNQTRQ